MKNRLIFILPIFIFLAGSLLLFTIAPSPQPLGSITSSRNLKVLAYSSFIASWGPGPWIAQEFEKRSGVHVEFENGGDAGLLLAKLKLFSADVVVGFDQFLLEEARSQMSWQKLDADATHKDKWSETDFVAFDWAPLTFVYRKANQNQIPRQLDDLLSPRFQNSLSLEDPRTSAPGLSFLFWVLDSKGVDQGFGFLRKLKASTARVSPSWSTAYGFFTKRQAALAFSYLTSPVYHEMNEHDLSYASSVFKEGQPAEIEYAGSPVSCTNCADARAFLNFLLEADVQKKIMTVNSMLPVMDGVTDGTPFAQLPTFQVYQWRNLPDLQRRQSELLKRWESVGL